ncbi:MAG: hypothetical protein IPN67_12990 [Bacteroidales bacterium]|nr:hypothetical protein [Bacteroidales bacterium]
MEKLKKEYRILKSQITDCQSVIKIIQDMEENLVPKGRGYTNESNIDALNYIYCLEENLGIKRYSVEKQIVQCILKLIDEGKSFYAEFVPYKYPTNTTDYIINKRYLLCEDFGTYYLLSGNKIPNAETYLININKDPVEAIDSFRAECRSFIEIRKNIDSRFDLSPEKRANLEKVEYNDIPKFDEIIKKFSKANGCHPIV